MKYLKRIFWSVAALLAVCAVSLFLAKPFGFNFTSEESAGYRNMALVTLIVLIWNMPPLGMLKAAYARHRAEGKKSCPKHKEPL